MTPGTKHVKAVRRSDVLCDLSKTEKYKCFTKTKNEGPRSLSSILGQLVTGLQALVDDMSHQQSQATAV
jgi:hypothetical protein